MQSTIREGHSPAVVVALAAGETITSEAGAMMFVSGDVDMDVQMPGGLTGGLKRKLLSGESMFVTTYRARAAGAVGLCGPFPGSIREHALDGEIVCERHSYLGHHGAVTLEPILARGAGLGFRGGGEGLFMQRIRGSGTVWLHGGGDFLDFDLVAGQKLAIDTGCMVMVTPDVRYELKLQSSLTKGFFGGEGLFLVELTGPGHVTLQTLPFSRTARRVLEAAGGGQGESGTSGGVLGRLLSD
jgi:uncharacterized protein (TIGR00266 family)